ncbi:MAG TPA: 16S rRNA (adenine(1518)-N(6)/adenine(1519)-N(6))-dimethyltransferase RsmA [Gammaproteobacteria bacterium]|nr:16S rRNA (adenine(1518)-N(6)/adenine(1519)-N(6))-dimethyltransferase RsmA [Xanthomonadales bacterium]MCB1594939.1 16S rRNA (adenine(1518)-N(6)/adenine(1519)-N(6))-dimethyltransferase RsmA [Xanthomonadales bacterium]HOP21669.1 16S rRNA (adenine(1518)-N(6)/adenine(1519)-N(6))-dimethyltransferase RsmA [Gammaproteobacteria bacterium]HPI95787.1 16S rRNA (adenine(1518)-N(6)/adenine(1519)-N(6))-dimethyltransferase RsmA [Gammaproteobacteria bacterium]HPQ87661.1 16S rRNA (adenine(1518)-N(6)/adenine(1
MSNKYSAKKRFGQNFLQDHSVIERIINAFVPKENDTIYEIGPGQAALSNHLVEYCNHVQLVEIDDDLVPALKAQFATKPNVTILHQDALELELTEPNCRIIGNLPYNVSTPLLIRFLYQSENISDMLFMLQKEVVKRICAEVGTKAYGRLSVMLQYAFDCEELFIVKPESFHPQPKVDSQIVRLVKKQEIPIVDLQKMESLVKQAFGQRRKTIKNNLKGILTDDDFEKLAIDPKLRPESITIEEYVNITNLISD